MMKLKLILIAVGLILVLFSYSFSQVPQLINFQGKLTASTGAPVNDTLPIIFSIYADEGGITLLWTETQGAVILDKGVFNVLLGSVTPISSSVFDGSVRYLGVKVGEDPEITPRKPMVSVPYAFKSFDADTADYARSSAGSGTCDWTFRITDGADTTLWTCGAWGIARAGNILYGNADSTHVNLGVGSTTGNSVLNSKYCTVGGGVLNTASRDYATVAGGYGNTAGRDFTTIAGGKNNSATMSEGATIGGGADNSSRGRYSYIGGGSGNTINYDAGYSTIDGGQNNQVVTGGVYDSWGTVGGGLNNLAYNDYATVSGGRNNTAGGATRGEGCTVGGGLYNIADGRGSTVSGGANNAALNGGMYLAYSTIGGGQSDTANALYSGVFCGYSNFSGDTAALVVGGYNNSAIGPYSTVGGGYSNWVRGRSSTIAGGDSNNTLYEYATVSGGKGNSARGGGSTIGGGFGNDINSDGGYNTIGGGYGNKCYGGAETGFGTVGGGDGNEVWSVNGTIGGGSANTVNGYCSTVPGGSGNSASAAYSLAAGNLVTVALPAAYTLAFGYNFTTSTPNAVIFHNSVTPIKVGIGTTAPTTRTDIDGDIAIRAGSFAAINGNNNDISIGERSFVRITGPNAAFTITGISGGQDGKIVILYNTTGQNMTVANESLNSLATNRILTMTGANEASAGTGNVTLIYDSTGQRWIVTAIKP